MIWNWVKNKKVFTCPINQIDPATHKTWRSESKEYVRSYCLPKNVARQIVDQLPKPTKTVLLFEKGSQPVFTYADSTGEWFDQTYGYGRNAPSNFWHDNGKNFAFCDGHAAYFKYPGGPFSYDYPNFTAWSTPDYPNSPCGDAKGRQGYCGYADTNRPGDPGGCKWLAGANIPR